MFVFALNKIIMAYRRLSPHKNLDQQILPLVNHVHQHKIISYEQFKQELLISKENPNIMNQTLPVFTQPNSLVNKILFKNQGPTKKRKPHLHKNNANLISIGDKKTLQQKGNLFVSPTSKVKRHLAGELNIKIMRQAMFQERKQPNRYELFCKSLRSKDTYSFPQKRQQSTKQTYRFFSSQIDKTISVINENFRPTTRKIFWVKNRYSYQQQQQKQQSPQFLSIKCFSRQKKS